VDGRKALKRKGQEEKKKGQKRNSKKFISTKKFRRVVGSAAGTACLNHIAKGEGSRKTLIQGTGAKTFEMGEMNEGEKGKPWAREVRGEPQLSYRGKRPRPFEKKPDAVMVDNLRRGGLMFALEKRVKGIGEKGRKGSPAPTALGVSNRNRQEIKGTQGKKLGLTRGRVRRLKQDEPSAQEKSEPAVVGDGRSAEK